MNKEDILKKIREKAIENDGKPLGKKRFYVETGIKEGDWSGKYWIKWGDAIIEAGYLPNGMNESFDEDYLLNKYAGFISEIGHIPCRAELKMKRWECIDFPSANTFTKFGNKKELLLKIFDFCKDKPHYSNVLDILVAEEYIGESDVEDIEEITHSITTEIQNYELYIPRILDGFLESSKNENMSLEFERKVNVCFSTLGFDVENLGQGKGRNPDGIAKSKKDHYAIIIDAKTRKEKYSIGTDDRKFIEYINTYSRELKLSGFEDIFLLIVSNEFTGDNELSIKRIQNETKVMTSMLSASMLLKIVACRIKWPSKMEYYSFKNVFKEGRIIDNKANAWYQEIFT